MKNFNFPSKIAVVSLCIIFFSGCAFVLQKGRRSDVEKIEVLRQELAELRTARSLLKEKLADEIKDKRVKLDMQERGLVITVLAEVLFDSGKAELRKESFDILSKVAEIFKDELRKHQIGIEGHTDNVPIKHSGWKTNWELSAHRALSVLHYLEEQGVDPARLSAIGYGKYKPVSSNQAEKGRQLNRRVEIIVLPRLVKKLDLEEEVLKGSIPEEILK